MKEKIVKLKETAGEVVEILTTIVYPILWGILLGLILSPLILLAFLGLKLLFLLIF